MVGVDAHVALEPQFYLPTLGTKSQTQRLYTGVAPEMKFIVQKELLISPKRYGGYWFRRHL